MDVRHNFFSIWIFQRDKNIKSVSLFFLLFLSLEQRQLLLRTIVCKKTDDWFIEWQRGYNEWQRIATSGNEWQRVVQRMAMSGTTSDNEWYNEWLGMTTSAKSDREWQRVIKRMNESKYNRVILCFKMKKMPTLFLDSFISILFRRTGTLFKRGSSTGVFLWVLQSF